MRPAIVDQPAHSTGKLHHPAVLVVAVVLAITLAAGTVWWAGPLATRQTAAVEQARWVQLVLLVQQAHVAMEDELNALAATAIADPDSTEPTGPLVDPASAARAEAVTALDAELDRLAQATSGGALQDVARQLQTEYADLPSDADSHPVMGDVLIATQRAEELLSNAVRSDPTITAVTDLAAQSSLPRLIVNDALDGLFLHGGQQAAGWSDDYFAYAQAYLAGDGGWLDEDDGGQLTSPYLSSETLQEQLPEVWTELRAILDVEAADPLRDADAWARHWPPGTDDPTPSVDVLLRAAASVSAGADALVVATAEEIIATADATAASAARDRTLVLVIGLLLTALVAAVAVWAAGRQWMRIGAWRSAALVDALTGLDNRRSLQAFADRARTTGDGGCGLLLFDLDHFKAINDTYGHQVGDDALIALADAARATAASIPGAAMVARTGGDEFVILAHGLTDPAVQAGVAAAALVDAVTTIELPVGHEIVTLSVSVGIAAASDVPPLEDLLLQADSALYDVKRNGRGGHRTYVDPPPSSIPSTG